MEFAKRELEKYGWTEGQGLGKNEDGIVKALKPKLKFDNAGIGHDISEEFNNEWWHKLYDEASRNIGTEFENNEVIIKTKKPAKRKKKKSKKQDLDDQHVEYKGFIKTSNLNDSREERLVEYEINEELNTSGDETVDKRIPDLFNEELFKVCGGRTAHKGARHGLKMSAKLARIKEQEKKFNEVGNKVLVNKNEFNEVDIRKKRKLKYQEITCSNFK